MLAADILARVAAIDAAALCDADKGIRVMGPGLRPVTSSRQMLGRARTVRGRDDFLTVIQALHGSEPGGVLVVDGGGSTRALAGELFATEAVWRKLAGIVIDGACRDTSRLATLQLPFYARWVCPAAGTAERLGTTQQTDDWRIQVGADGDSNRRMNSGPVLWELTGDVRGLAVLDAGCGTGYLSGKLRDKGTLVTGVDFAERMVEIARADHPGVDFRVDSCTEFATLADGQFDLVIANYVLMDTPDLDAAMRAFHRALKPGGVAVLVFSHPCFPQGNATVSEDGREVAYRWDFPYFEPTKCTDPPWAHFKDEFLWFHRPLSDYWKAFVAAGFAVVGFEEPRVTEDRYKPAESEKKLRNSKTRPYSVAFKLRKPSSIQA